MYKGKPGSTDGRLLTDEHVSAFSPQTVCRISDLRSKWVARNQSLLARARQLINEGSKAEGDDRQKEFLPEELCEPWDSAAEAEMNAQRDAEFERTPRG